MSVIVYASDAACVAFLNQYPVVPACDDNPESVALACAVVTNPDTGEVYYDFTATIDPDVVAKCVSVDGRRAQAYPFSDLQQAAIQAEIAYLVSAATLQAGDVTLTEALPSDWVWPQAG